MAADAEITKAEEARKRSVPLARSGAILVDVHKSTICTHSCYTVFKGAKTMPTAKSRTIHKHFRLDSIKLKRAQKVLEARTETETVELALDLAISEHERNRLTAEANQRFLKSGIIIRDVFGAPGQ